MINFDIDFTFKRSYSSRIWWKYYFLKNYGLQLYYAYTLLNFLLLKLYISFEDLEEAKTNLFRKSQNIEVNGMKDLRTLRY